ncbi:MAG TPA: NADP-dependent oxidoreductase, partial [Acidimicrobiales bacterium]|nr:NADP-dependent oxidoreductase [Acidimicrobiales bacterium]
MDNLSGETLAVVATGFGGPEVLTLMKVPIALPGPGEVRIAMRAAGTNPLDVKLYGGAMGSDPSALPMRLGREAAGVVVAVGGEASGPTGKIEVGDQVIAFPALGSYAAEVVVPSSSVLRKPEDLPFEQASGLLLTGSTAVHAINVVALSKGDRFLIHGGSGGVGLMAVQLAVAAGARVFATASESRHAYVQSLGAEPVAYGEGLVDRVRDLSPSGVDAALDAVGSDETIDASVELVADPRRVASLVATKRAFDVGFRVLGAAPGADPGTEIRAAARGQLIEAAEAGRLQVLVSATYPLREAATAHAALASGHTNGKI